MLEEKASQRSTQSRSRSPDESKPEKKVSQQPSTVPQQQRNNNGTILTPGDVINECLTKVKVFFFQLRSKSVEMLVNALRCGEMPGGEPILFFILLYASIN